MARTRWSFLAEVAASFGIGLADPAIDLEFGDVGPEKPGGRLVSTRPGDVLELSFGDEACLATIVAVERRLVGTGLKINLELRGVG